MLFTLVNANLGSCCALTFEITCQRQESSRPAFCTCSRRLIETAPQNQWIGWKIYFKPCFFLNPPTSTLPVNCPIIQFWDRSEIEFNCHWLCFAAWKLGFINKACTKSLNQYIDDIHTYPQRLVTGVYIPLFFLKAAM